MFKKDQEYECTSLHAQVLVGSSYSIPPYDFKFVVIYDNTSA